MKRGCLAEPAHQQSEDQHGGNVRTAAYWLRKAVRARASANRYTADRAELENIAEIYEWLAEQRAGFDSDGSR
jgi:hypothetical protein